jgi:hypothetical protein
MIGVGIAGAGYFGAVHARAIAAVQELRIVAVSASSEASSATFAAEHGGRACVDWRGLLDDKEVDVILNAMPHHLHAEVTIAAAQAGKHVLVDKPMAPTLAKCCTMIARRGSGQCADGGAVDVFTCCPVSPPRHSWLAARSGGLVSRSDGEIVDGIEPARLASQCGDRRRHAAHRWHPCADRLVWLMVLVESVAAMSRLFHDHAVPMSMCCCWVCRRRAGRGCQRGQPK